MKDNQKDLKEARPKLQIPRSRLEWAFEITSSCMVFGLIIFSAMQYPHLPERIPTHFNAAGEVDGWGPRGAFLILPGMAFLLYGLLTLISRFPHNFNYPWPITEQNAKRQYELARLLLTTLKTFIPASFLSIVWAIASASQGQASLGWWFLPLFLIAIFASIGIYFRLAYRAR